MAKPEGASNHLKARLRESTGRRQGLTGLLEGQPPLKAVTPVLRDGRILLEMCEIGVQGVSFAGNSLAEYVLGRNAVCYCGGIHKGNC